MFSARRIKMMNRSIPGDKTTPQLRSNFTGLFPSGKNDRLISYRSLLERDFIVLLEDDRDVSSFSERPDRLEWSDGCAPRETICEFGYQHAFRGRVLAAVKPSATLAKYELAELFDLARPYAREAGYAALEVWTEKEIRVTPRLANAEMRVFQQTPNRNDAHVLAARTAMLDGGGRMPIGELRDRSNLGEDAYRTILRLVADGVFHPEDPDALLDDHAMLRAKGRKS
jgi:hypothetical protein